MSLQDLDQTGQKQAPSPNRYLLKSTIGDVPKISMGTRTVIPSESPRRYLNMPEPASYNIQRTAGSDSPKITMSGRHSVANPTINFPAPGSYSPSKKSQGPCFSLGGRTHLPEKSGAAITPGPGRYLIPTKIGSGPQCSMGVRTSFGNMYHVNRDTRNIGPGSHSLPSSVDQLNKISMGTRTYIQPKEGSPGPGAYSVDVAKSGKAISISGRPAKGGLIRTEM